MVTRKEIWKDVIGYEGMYRVSNFSRIKSLKRGKQKILTQSYDNYGYQVVNLHKNGTKKTMKVHRLVMIAFIPNPLNKEEVNHKNGIKSDKRLQNLEWATPSENVKHAHRIGLKNHKGENHPRHKLTQKQIDEIREILQKPNRPTYKIIGKQFGVGVWYICFIATGKRWNKS